MCIRRHPSTPGHGAASLQPPSDSVDKTEAGRRKVECVVVRGINPRQLGNVGTRIQIDQATPLASHCHKAIGAGAIFKILTNATWHGVVVATYATHYSSYPQLRLQITHTVVRRG